MLLLPLPILLLFKPNNNQISAWYEYSMKFFFHLCKKKDNLYLSVYSDDEWRTTCGNTFPLLYIIIYCHYFFFFFLPVWIIASLVSGHWNWEATQVLRCINSNRIIEYTELDMLQEDQWVQTLALPRSRS